MDNVLCYTVAFGAYDCELAVLLVDSLRASGFLGDVVVFSDRDYSFPGAVCVNVAKHDARDPLHVAGTTYHARSGSGLDYLLMRMLPHHFYDLSRYQFLLYADTDVLFFQNPYPAWMDPESIFIQQDCESLWFNLSPIKHLLPVLQEGTDNQPGYCSGLFCMPRKHWHVLDEWRQLFLQVPAEERHQIGNQRFLNYLLWSKAYPPKSMTAVSTGLRTANAVATHYWQHAHDALWWAYLTYIRPELAARHYGQVFVG